MGGVWLRCCIQMPTGLFPSARRKMLTDRAFWRPTSRHDVVSMDGNLELDTRTTGSFDSALAGRFGCPPLSSFPIDASLSPAHETVGGRRSSDWRLCIGLCVVVCMGTQAGCRTDQVTQARINEMRAEQIAYEDRYAALRNEYEKLRMRLAAQGDRAASQPEYPSALPLQYPPEAVGPTPQPTDGFPPDSLLERPIDSPVEPMNPSELPSGQASPSHGALSSPTDSRQSSLMESALGRQDSKPTQLWVLFAKTTRVADVSDGTSHLFEAVIQPVDAWGGPANRPATYALRLSDPTKTGADSELGYWHFPPERVREFLTNQGGGDGIPLRVKWKTRGELPGQILAEFEYLGVGGERLEHRQIVNTSGVELPPFQEWVQTLPRPSGTQGLMSSARGDAGNTNSAPSLGWRPTR